MIVARPMLYKLDNTNKTRVWYAEVDGGRYRTISGVLNGKLVTTEWTYSKPKNVGKANETTAAEQANLEVDSLYTKRMDMEYKENISDIGNLSYFKPMLAAKWEDCVNKISFTEGLFAQPKLDGIRCIFTKDGPKSRTGKEIVAIPHIVEALAPLFKDNPDLILDGELYNHQFKDDFNSIISMVRKTKPSAEDINISKNHVQYHVYDLPSDDRIFNYRFLKLKSLLNNFSDYVQLVQTDIVFSEEEVDNIYGEYLTNGYEGGIIRLNKKYEQKRSKSLLKRKDFEDEEFEIIRIEEGQGNWAGYAKRVVFRNNDGREVGAGLKGNQEYAKAVLAEANEYIGKQATIQFFTRTPDGVPRFPVAKALHKHKRW